VLLLAIGLAGCAGPVPRFGNTALPEGMTRDELLTGIAACHLHRVAQTGDLAVTDAAVIAAVERWRFTVEEMVARSNELIEAAANPTRPSALRQLSTAACRRLAALTEMQPGLVRFDDTGNPGTTWLAVEGQIGDGFAEQVITKLRDVRAVGLIIESPGGSLYEARRLGRWLRENGLRVAVSGLCTSACVDVLAGGIERLITPDAKLGIHQSRVPRHMSSHEGGQLSVVTAALYLREMGVDDSVALAAAAVPNDRMYWISVAEALETGLATKLVGPL
jgi:ATP-dependent protease ClpP protease subunit